MLLDASGGVFKQYAARTTPQVFLVDPEGRLIYRGDRQCTIDPGRGHRDCGELLHKACLAALAVSRWISDDSLWLQRQVLGMRFEEENSAKRDGPPNRGRRYRGFSECQASTCPGFFSPSRPAQSVCLMAEL